MSIIVCNGPPGSGKDAVCDHLKNKDFVHIEFKKKLFEDVIEYFGVDSFWFYNGYTRETKDKKEPSLGNMSRREALIHVSENISKVKYGNDYYGKLSANEMYYNINYCISDGGFPEELSHIINKFGEENIIMLRIYRTGSTYDNDSRKYINCKNNIKTYICGQETDTTMLSKQCFDQTLNLKCITIHNNGTLYELHEVIDGIVRNLNDRQN